MNIGLLTFHDTTNFGSLLQTYGLYKKITDLGCNCEIIDYQCENIVKKEKPHPLRLSLNPKVFLKDILYGRYMRKKYDDLSDFLHRNMKVSRRYTREDIQLSVKDYDKILVGSDIVWGMDITGNDYTYFLDFVSDKKKKYAFSSSIGNPWTEDQKGLIAPLLDNFSYIAVREEEAANWVEDIIGRRPDVVCDPTMLVDPCEWRTFVSIFQDGDYVLVYFDNNKHECLTSAIRYAKLQGLKVYYINYGRGMKGCRNLRPSRVEEFLSLIFNAKMVFTASYHGMLFSLYFNKQIVFFNRAHKSRMKTLASKLHIENSFGENVDVTSVPYIDYESVNKSIAALRLQSIECLNIILRNNGNL